MRNEYPRPELVRENWLNLNGEWDFEFDFGDTLEGKLPLTSKKNNIMYNVQKNFTQKINVPFCPESELSGIGYTKFIYACWYRKTIFLEKHENKRWILNFEAAFHKTHVFVNGKLVCVHKGGYTPFSVDITDYTDGETEIKVHCSGNAKDPRQPSGKQSPIEYSYGCFYTRSTGIWQTVWLEEVPKSYVQKLKITPDVDNAMVNVTVGIVGDGDKTLRLEALLNGQTVGSCRYKANGKLSEINCQMSLSKLALWDTVTPNLYDLKITLESETGKDVLTSYFGMRKLELDHLGLKLNGKRVFQRLVLDQGYYPKGIYTAECEEELKADILRSKRFGFNGARLHEKVFERRYLYWADKLGYLVWGEYPNWSFDHSQESALLYFLPEWLESVERDYNHPSIIGWCPMNENFDFMGNRQCNEFVEQVYLETKRADKTRPCIDVSWNYHTKTDIYDVHDYVQDMKVFTERFGKFEDGKVHDTFPQVYAGQPFFLSEYGGLKWPVDAKGWAYNSEEIKTEDDFADRFNAFTKVLFSNPRVCAFCYTQLTDVEQETNGLYYYDRTDKFEAKTIEKMYKMMTEISEYEKQD